MQNETKPFGILFLDVDGVICTDRAYYASGQDKTKSILRTWDKTSIDLISRLCVDYDLEVVISSTWRTHYDVPLILLTHGFEGSFHKDDKTPAKFSSIARGSEIYEWLDNHKDVKNFIIIDDTNEGIVDSNLHSFHVQTDFEDGVLSKHYRQAKDILQKQKDGIIVYNHHDRWLEFGEDKE